MDLPMMDLLAGTQRAAPSLPLWRVLARAGIARCQVLERAGNAALRQAELRCTLCIRRAQCAARLPEGLPDPCPNSRMLAELT